MVLTEEEYQRLASGAPANPAGGITALQWLLSNSPTGKRSKAQIDADLKAGRDW